MAPALHLPGASRAAGAHAAGAHAAGARAAGARAALARAATAVVAAASAAAAAAAAAGAGCVGHIAPYTPKTRPYRADAYEQESESAHRPPGSVHTDAMPGLFEDPRAARVGDIVQVRIEEEAAAESGADTELSREAEVSANIGALAGIIEKIRAERPELDPDKLIDALTRNDFSGKGRTSRAGRLRATFPARVKRVLPNGDLYVEGHKVVLLNDEENHLYVSGVIRPDDIDADNSVSSQVVADAQVEFTGRGVVADTNSKGWLARVLDKVWPF